MLTNVILRKTSGFVKRFFQIFSRFPSFVRPPKEFAEAALRIRAICGMRVPQGPSLPAGDRALDRQCGGAVTLAPQKSAGEGGLYGDVPGSSRSGTPGERGAGPFRQGLLPSFPFSCPAGPAIPHHDTRIHSKQDNCLVLIAPTARWILMRRTDAQSAAVPIKIS